MTDTKTPLVTASRLTDTAEAGQWLCRDWMGRPLLVRRTKSEALADGRALALENAARACLNLSRFC